MPLYELGGHEGSVISVALRGTLGGAASFGGSALLYDLTTGRECGRFETTSRAPSIAFPDLDGNDS